MRKLIFIFSILIVTVSFVMAQTEDEDYFTPTENNRQTAFSKNKFDVSVQLGTSFGSFSGNGNSFGSYIMPGLNYRINPAFSLTGGFGYSRASFENAFIPLSDVSFASFNGKSVGKTAFISGSYQVNPRLTVSGTAYYEQTTFSPYRKEKMYQKNYTTKSMSMSFQYQLTEKMSIGVEFRQTTTNNPYHIYQQHTNTFGRQQFSAW